MNNINENTIERFKSSDDILQRSKELYSDFQIRNAIEELAEEINASDDQYNLPLILTVMNGGMIFAGELISHLNFPLEYDSINFTRYQDNSASDEIKEIHYPKTSVKDRHVILLDDILDEGVTLKAIHDWCISEGALSVTIAVMILRENREQLIEADYVVFSIKEDLFIFGFGLDYNGFLRNYPGIRYVK